MIMKSYNARSHRRAVRSQSAIELAPALRNRHSQLTDLFDGCQRFWVRASVLGETSRAPCSYSAPASYGGSMRVRKLCAG